MKPGIYHGLSYAEYDRIAAVNNSLLKAAAKSMRHGWEYLNLPRPEPSPAMQYGTDVHTATWEPQNFVLPEFLVRPAEIDGKPWHGNRNVCKEWMRAHDGANIVSQDEADEMRRRFDAIKEAARLIREHPHVADLLGEGQPEVTVVANRQHPNALIKARLDWYRRGIILDLKTTTDASTDSFSREIARFGYHRQAAFYVDAVRALGEPYPKFGFIAFEKGDRPQINVRFLDIDSIEQGRREYDRILSKWLQACADQDWPGYDEGLDHPGEIRLPGWAFDRLEDDLDGAEVCEHALMGGAE